MGIRAEDKIWVEDGALLCEAHLRELPRDIDRTLRLRRELQESGQAKVNTRIR